MIRLCCFFNYAPLYRESIYKKIDDTFDTQFYFGDEVYENGRVSNIEKINYSIFKKKPIEFKNLLFLKYFSWRTKAITLPFKHFDIILLTGDFVFSYIPLIILSKLFKIKIFGWGHGIKTRKGKLHFFNDFFYRSLNGFFTYGEKGRQRLIDLGYNPKKIHIIYNSLTPRGACGQSYKSNIYQKHFNNNNPVLIFIGRLTPQKQLDWLLRVLADLNANGRNCNLVIVGDGVERTKLEQISNDLNVSDKVWFYGKCYDTNKNSELLYNADLCISPGNVGLTALHALEYGTPVISHDDFETQMPEYETITSGLTGRLYKKNDYCDFYSNIEQWLINSPSREDIRNYCYDMINGKWNSDNQLEILQKIFNVEY